MHSLAIAVPIRPGKTEDWRRYAQALANEHRDEMNEDFRRFRTLREIAWLQQTQNHDMAILFWEVEDPELHRQQFQEIMASDEPFYVWQRESMMDLFGFDPTQPRPPMPELVHDHQVNGGGDGYAVTSTAIVVPLKHGKEERWKQHTRELISSRRTDVERDWQRFGIHRAASWLQQTTNGHQAILVWELDDPSRLTERSQLISESEEDYYAELRKSLSDVFDIDRVGKTQPAELIFEYRAT